MKLNRNKNSRLANRLAAGLGGRSLVALALLAGVAQAQTPSFVVSTSSDISALGMTDGDLVSVGAGQTPRQLFAGGHFRALYGATPGDVDAVTYQPGATIGRVDAWAFSLLSNEAGFKDGDVLGFAPSGGLMVMVSEDELALSLGITGTSLDVDAATFDASGRLVFSLQANMAGTNLGDLSDGDILRQESDGSITRVHSEADVQAFVDAAGVSGTIADVQGVHAEGDELWVCVQSPSSHDGAVIAIGANPRVIATEDELSLNGSELNALCVASSLPELSMIIDTDEVAAGATIQGDFQGATNDTALVLWSGAVATVEFSQAAGFGRWYLSPTDPWLFQSLSILPVVALDAQGQGVVTYTLPGNVAGAGLGSELGWSFQALSLSNFSLSSPFRVASL